MIRCGVGRERASSLFDLYGKTEQDLGMKIYHTLGNHDCFGVYPASGVSPTDPLYGKKIFEARFGKAYYSFDHKGVHFVVLDSIGITDDRAYEGRVDPAQLAWLATDLRALPAATADHCFRTHSAGDCVLILTCPVPATPSKASRPERRERLRTDCVYLRGIMCSGVLQGHTHINETVMWTGVPVHHQRGGERELAGTAPGWGRPEGFTVVRIENGKLSTRYETYGFQSVDPQNT